MRSRDGKVSVCVVCEGTNAATKTERKPIEPSEFSNSSNNVLGLNLIDLLRDWLSVKPVSFSIHTIVAILKLFRHADPVPEVSL